MDQPRRRSDLRARGGVLGHGPPGRVRPRHRQCRAGTSGTTGRWSAWEWLGGTLHGRTGSGVGRCAGKLDVFARGNEQRSVDQELQRWRHRLVGMDQRWAARSPPAPARRCLLRAWWRCSSAGTDGRYYYRQRSAALVWSPGWQVADAALAFRGLGAWVDTLDYSALSPATVVADLQVPPGAHPVPGDRAVRQRHRHPLPRLTWPPGSPRRTPPVSGWSAGMSPDYADLTRDVRRTLAIATYVSPAGQRFDAHRDRHRIPAHRAQRQRVEPGGRHAARPGPRRHRTAGRGDRAAAGAHAGPGLTPPGGRRSLGRRWARTRTPSRR